MPSIPTYQRQFLAQGDLQGARANTNVAPDDAIGSAMRGLGQQGMGLANTMMRVESQEKQEEDAIATSNILSMGDIHFQKRANEMAKNWKVGDPDISEALGKELQEWRSSNIEKLQTKGGKKYFQQHTDAMNTRLQTGAFTYMEKEREAKTAVDTEIAIKADAEEIRRAPHRLAEILQRRIQPMIATSGGTAKTTEAVDKILHRFSLEKEIGEAEKDPEKYLRDRYGEVQKVIKPSTGGGSNVSVDASGLDPRQAARLERVRFTPQHESAIAAASGGDASKAAWLRAAVTIENRGNDTPNDKAVSPVGAKGAFQFMEATGKQYGLMPDERGDFAKSALAAGKFYDDLSKMYGGNQRAMLAHYNGGGAAGRAVMNGREPPAQETRDYLKMGAALGVGRGVSGPGIQTAAVSTGNVSDAGSGMPMPPMPGRVMLDTAPATAKAIGTDAVNKITTMAEGLVKQRATEVFTGVAMASARSVIDTIQLEPDGVIDIPKAKADAVAKAEIGMGPLNEQQRATVETAVEKAASDKERDRKRQEATDTQTVFDMLDKNGGDIVALQRDAQPLLARIGRGAKERSEKYAGMVATGETRTTDWTAYKELVENPAALKGANLSAMRDKFGATELGQLAKMQDSLNKDTSSEDNIRTNMVVVKEMLKEAKITDVKKEAKFFSMLQSAIDQELLATGKKALKQSEIKALADDLLVKTITSKGILWDSEEASFNIPVPPTERAKIEAALASNGLPVNDYEVMRQYRKKLQNKSVLQKPIQSPR